MSEISWEERQRETAEAMADPQLGDRFTEMHSYWVYVVDLGVESVTTLEAGAPCSFPDDGEVRVFASRAEFRSRYAYGGGHPGYWVKLAGRGHDVTGWASAGATKAKATAESGGSLTARARGDRDG